MGFQQGFDEGKEQGTEKGHAQGFEKGEKEGLEKGEKQGFEKGEKEGFEQGFQKGETEAEAKTREKGLEILRSLEETLKTSDTALDEMITKYEEDIISLVCKITEKVVMAKLETDNEIVRHTVMDALKSLANPEEIVLSISSEDYEYIEMIKDEFFEVIDSLKGVSVNTDPSVQRGGCRIETSTASITADPQEKLKAVFDTLTSPGEDIE
ncbi:MAG: flagellar biosynthesis/type III secretory pathway protein, partial [Desulfobacteraceae bacterium]|nr:flagellar biosynthesis/type III secretory pathway protein [Desulfobacteraceae bacterium]